MAKWGRVRWLPRAGHGSLEARVHSQNPHKGGRKQTLLMLSSDLYTCALACMLTRAHIVHTHDNRIGSNYHYFIKRMTKGNSLLWLLAYEKQMPEMAQQVKAYAAKPNSLCWVPRTHVMEQKNRLSQAVS